MNNFLLKIPAFLVLTLLSCSTFAQKSKIKELDFLIGTWEVLKRIKTKAGGKNRQEKLNTYSKIHTLN